MAEANGIPTISMANRRDRMGYVKPPRALFVEFPRGSMLGEPLNTKRQRKIILDALDALQTMKEPGTVYELPYRWQGSMPSIV
jgi:D-proline reductase (dithiol) PrdB